MQCQKCRAPFCSGCGLDHKTYVSCDEYTKMLEERKKIGNGIVPCPKCAIPTQRLDGCNYMTCRCGQHFCNLCGGGLDDSKHFSHFKGKPFDNDCLGPKDGIKI